MDPATNICLDYRHSDPNEEPQCRDESLFVGGVDEEYICPVGHGVLRNPVMTPCQHEFCKKCLQTALRHRDECPLCRTALKESDLRPAYKTSRQVQKLPAYCCNKNRFCDWEGIWSELEAHKATCPFEPLQCDHCFQLIQRNLLKDHVQNCDKRPVACPHCNGEFPYCELEKHIQECPKKVVTCQLCLHSLPYEDMADHEGSHCQLAMVSCPFAEYGCPSPKMERRNLESHISEVAAMHVFLLCQKVSEQNKVITQQQTLITKLLRRTSVLVVQQPSSDALPDTTFPTISEALQNAESGDRIIVKNGTYRECINLDRSITIQAEGPHVVIENVRESNVVVMSGPGSLIGFRLRQKSPNFFCIRVTSDSEDTLISRCDIQSKFSCLQIESNANPTVTHNKIHSASQCGILVKKAGRGVIQHNEIFDNCLVNIYVDEQAEPQITENRIHSSQQHGVWVKPNVGPAAVVSENVIYDNAMSDVKLEEGANPKMIKNTFRSGEG